MDSAMRDMERLQEVSGDGTARRMATWVLGAGMLVAVILAFGVMLDRSTSDDAAAADPLDSLDRATGLAATAAPADGDMPGADDEPMADVRREALSFPIALAEVDGRPEVEAAMAAAAAEHDQLLLPTTTTMVTHRPGADRIDAYGGQLEPEASMDRLPAAVAAGSDYGALLRSARRDPLVHAALPARQAREPQAGVGRAGLYTLQVISYQSADEAESFAEGLRARGHHAFVEVADLPDRGRHHRVRIGPFETLRDAEAYRRSFEEGERMNTYVVRRRDDDA